MHNLEKTHFIHHILCAKVHIFIQITKLLGIFINLKTEKHPVSLLKQGASRKKVAASYSPALHCSTIGASGLNFSVRNGKRWDPAAITTWISLRSNEKWVMRSEKLEIINEKWIPRVFPLISYSRHHQARIRWQSSQASWSIGLIPTPEKMTYAKAIGQLVRLGFDVTVFTPASYQRPRLGRPSMEFSSCGWLRT